MSAKKLPHKVCFFCQKPSGWHKKEEKCCEDVKYCS
ncbi:DUF2256 domain-containing protein [Mucilaginibacter sp. FT3.2]